ncbi:hypothetical protein VOLCADRAFT_95039 [Volvox carteri f. nagariensis]|uniref:Uncharacterized protein n=1 Tax=Volvox carteri f. nagariensis TaxID=3068 RepID=D8U6F6_VOLCA|nr:uncharacterized protein VOLCADRAFT_95039 [Volvox carteri f. nagariensis]EFJ44638.1 hypothetical protein VOLCADRAFT_95039 [Volvox carteri f. nagariensis]|eukprot:XP_002954214.1 hypothetical protein VOLCADRAFT_95039 [Volvox carteri f. nagariensis]
MSCCGYDFVEGQGYRCPFVLVDTAASPSGAEFITWALDPQYFLYEGCECIEGYHPVWTPHRNGVPSMGPSLACFRTADPWHERNPWALVLIVLGGLLVASWLTYLMCFRHGKNAAIVRAFLNVLKRVQPEPKGVKVTVVVTDIEGYSAHERNPMPMTNALNQHNGIIRQARWDNFGYTVEQEGDSFSLAFYEPHDAVVFCLQTQLALNKQTWPEGLLPNDVREQALRRRGRVPSLLNVISTVVSNLSQSLFGGRVGLSEQQPSELSSEENPAAGTRQSSTAAGTTVSVLGASGLRLPYTEAEGIAAGGGDVGGGGRRSSSNSSHRSAVLFNGLRVRMGVATGTLPPGCSVKGSAVMELAKMVSDMANGGQILMDETTFKSIKERMEEFGAVDQNGMNYKKLNSIQPPCYPTCIKRIRNPDDALLLDMGEYSYCPGAKRLPLFQFEPTTATATATTPTAAAAAAAAEAAAAAGTGSAPSTPQAAMRRTNGTIVAVIRVFQILSPSLVGRAKVFGNKLALRDEWRCSDDPYLAAPGTLKVPLGPADIVAPNPTSMPYITMAFAIVEGAKEFAGKHRQDVQRVSDMCTACIRACLRVVCGGYMCRSQDGELKYMVAFACPESAVEWAVLLQDVMLYVKWPEAALKYWGRETYDERGRLVFRGPRSGLDAGQERLTGFPPVLFRMKIGLCEGCPRSITPDHVGRADYHGASVNQAARYMDAAAHGGMVVVEEGLALKVMDKWRAVAAAATVTAAPGSSRTSIEPAFASASAPAADAASSGSNGAGSAAGKGVKVEHASGLLDGCNVRLPDLVSPLKATSGVNGLRGAQPTTPLDAAANSSSLNNSRSQHPDVAPTLQFGRQKNIRFCLRRYAIGAFNFLCFVFEFPVRNGFFVIYPSIIFPPANVRLALVVVPAAVVGAVANVVRVVAVQET